MLKEWNKLMWKTIPVTTSHLSLKNTLMNGQCFNWKLVENNSYIGCVERKVILMKEEENQILYKYLYQNEKEDEEFLTNYFQFEIDISELYKAARGKLPTNLHNSLETYTGVRILKQEHLECILSFICSSNNNIDRIRMMLDKFRTNYGELIY